MSALGSHVCTQKVSIGTIALPLCLTRAGSIVGQGLTDHMDVRKVGFTGSTGIGQTIMKSAAESNVKKVSLELGGKSPLIIFSDCDLDKAVRLVRESIMLNGR